MKRLTAEDENARFDFSDFEENASHERANTTGATIRKLGRFTFLVRFTDSETTHETRIARFNGDHCGWCDCRDFQHREVGPCKHLWAVKLASERKVVDLHSIHEALHGEAICPTCGTTNPREGEI